MTVVLCFAATATFAEAAAQESGEATPSNSASCAQAVVYYELSPAAPETAARVSECFQALHKPEEAAGIFRRTAEKPGSPPIAWKYAAQAYRDANLFAEAEAAYLRYLQRTPNDIEARLSLAGLYIRRSAHEGAAEQYRQILSSRPNYSPALAGLARTFFWQGRHEESLQMFDRAMSANPRDAEASSGKAYALLWIGRSEEAQTLFSKLHDEHPRDDSITRGLRQAQAAVAQEAVAAALRSGNTASLETQYRQRLAQNPRDLSALRTLAELTAGPERCAERVGYRRQAVELAPTDATVAIELARSLATCRQLAEAIAGYQRVVAAYPENHVALFELGNSLRLAGRLPESIEILRKLLRLNPRDTDALLALARALAASGNDEEALLRYNEVLTIRPESYEALQGKAYLLFWTKKYAEARVIFEELAKRQPGDKQNAQVLEQIAAAERDVGWAAIRPAPNDPLEAWLQYYEKRMSADPKDISAMKGWAYTQNQLKNYPEAIRGYRRVLEAYPNDRGSKIDLARLLSWEGQFDESSNLYRELLKDTPSDTEVLENLARVSSWANRLPDALETYQKLLARNPSNAGYQLSLARLQLRLKDTPAAREFLVAVLAADPENREATLLLGQMNLTEGHEDAALQEFDKLLKRNPNDPEALFGKARAYYYQGDVNHAYAAASTLIQEQPENVDALFLTANLERVRRNRGAALTLLDRTLKLSPNHTEAQTLRKSIREAGTITLRTSASYLRETGSAAVVSGQPLRLNEDLRSYAYGVTLGFGVLPKTDSSLSMTLLPSSSPVGGLRGAAAPSQFFYRQTSQVAGRLKLRGGVGLVRFGPGEPVRLPGHPEPVRVTQFSPLALVGLSYEARKLTLDASWNRSSAAYTPTATRFGVIENRGSASASLSFNSRSGLYLNYYYGRYSTGRFDHITFVNGQRIVERRSEHDKRHSGSAVFTVNLLRSNYFSFDAGYDGHIYGHRGRQVFLGFYNPGFSQAHLFKTHFFGRLWGPLRYDFSGGIGVQHSKDDGVRRGVQLHPSFNLRVSSHLSLNFGYAYYNTAQTLSTLSGNAVHLSTNWTF